MVFVVSSLSIRSTLTLANSPLQTNGRMAERSTMRRSLSLMVAAPRGQLRWSAQAERPFEGGATLPPIALSDPSERAGSRSDEQEREPAGRKRDRCATRNDVEGFLQCLVAFQDFRPG